MNFHCLQFQHQPFVAQLNVTQDTLSCVIRNRQLSAKPEEFVRQSLLKFLTTQCQDLYPHKIDIKVEYQSMDIAVYPAPLPNRFHPSLPPVLIIETKSREVQPLDTENNERQLADYLNLQQCETGILANCNSIFCYCKSGNKYHKKELNDLLELKQLIKNKIKLVTEVLLKDQEYFYRARAGCYVSFIKLAQKYGFNANSKLTFVYENDGTPERVTGFLFKFDVNQVSFRLQGMYTERRRKFTKNEFRELIAIEPLICAD